MIIHDRSFPYPVLAPFRDDVMPNEFSLAVAVDSDADHYYLNTRFEYNNATLAALIHEGRATHAVHIECKRNFYRELHSLPGRDNRIVANATDIVGRVEVTGFISALVPLESYRIDGAHTDYGETTFLVSAGDVLAVARTVVFDAYVDYDPLSTISSILTVQCAEAEGEGPLTLDTSGNRIVATLARPDYDRYTDLKGDPSISPLLANQVVVPAILEAVQEIKGTAEDDVELEMEKRWFRSIAKKLEDLGIDIRHSDSSVLGATQALLRLPLRRSLEGISQISDLEGEE